MGFCLRLQRYEENLKCQPLPYYYIAGEILAMLFAFSNLLLDNMLAGYKHSVLNTFFEKKGILYFCKSDFLEKNLYLHVFRSG